MGSQVGSPTGGCGVRVTVAIVFVLMLKVVVLAAPHTLDSGQGAVAHQCWAQSAAQTSWRQTQQGPPADNTNHKPLYYK